MYEVIEGALGQLEDWFYDPSYPMPDHWTFRSIADKDYGFLKVISLDTTSLNGNMMYYNFRHAHSVNIPKGMGVNQRGENMMGEYGNEFYNVDTTLVVSVYGFNYDAVLVDTPNYAVSLAGVNIRQNGYPTMFGYQKDK